MRTATGWTAGLSSISRPCTSSGMPSDFRTPPTFATSCISSGCRETASSSSAHTESGCDRPRTSDLLKQPGCQPPISRRCSGSTKGRVRASIEGTVNHEITKHTKILHVKTLRDLRDFVVRRRLEPSKLQTMNDAPLVRQPERDDIGTGSNRYVLLVVEHVGHRRGC